VSGEILLEAHPSLGGGELAGGGIILIGADLSGPIGIDGRVVGDIEVEGDVTGSVSVGRSLQSSGRIRIHGLCDGPISVGEETVELSQINITEGLGTSGSIVINESRGDYDADGTIFIGHLVTQQGPLPPVTFDGSIMVLDSTGGQGGDLNGIIKVSGCHDSSDNKDIYIC